MLRIRTLSLVAVLITGCSGTPADPWPEVLTLAAEPAFSEDDGIWGVPFTVTNLSSHTTYFVSACGDRPIAGVDRREGGRWVSYTSAICIAVLSSAPLALNPQETLESGIGLRDAGTYRLRLQVSSSRDARGKWSETSSSFVIQ